MNRTISAGVVIGLMCICCSGTKAAVVVATVAVGNPGNAGELSGESAGGYGPDGVCGAVDYVYEISKFEVTAGQYTEFLNAVAAADTYGLYNTSMWSNNYGCKIQRSGSSGSYTYSVAGDWADRPVNYVSWGDAARFANWMHNGQPTGVQNLSTTEDGSYYLNGATTNSALMAVARKPGATWVIPSEDEWYKAAFHYNDGVTGNYWDYATQSNTAPTAEVVPGTDMANGSANYYVTGYLHPPYYRTEGGAYNAKPSDSAYGTFDQSGNVWEWNEADVFGSGSSRGLRGGSFGAYVESLQASDRSGCYYPTYASFDIGFRVAQFPGQVPVEIQTVTVANPGNGGELSGDGAGGMGPNRICGAVQYVYDIGKFEVTAGQYTEFLNAVAATDTYALHNPSMWSEEEGCKIERSGSPGDYNYSVAEDWANRPVNFVSWSDAARFANWLHNGQPTGLQGPSTTEDGSYYLNGAATDVALMAVVRKPNATWVIPSEDEWYKAAYHKNDGVTGNYWDYPTSSNAVPSNVLLDPDPGNNASFWNNNYTIGSPYYRTEVGEFENSESPYVTFDQGGNVWEWIEAVMGAYRGLRGASYYTWAEHMRAADRHFGQPPTFEHHMVGFRVAVLWRDCNGNGVPDHEDIAQGTSVDENGNGIPDECECAMIAEAPQAEPTLVAKGRYLAFVPGNTGEQTALRLRLADLPSPFEAAEGASMWVGAPQDISEDSGSSGSTPPTFKGASLGCEPVYTDWGSIGVLHVYGAAIVPGGAYQIQAINQACFAGVEANYSAPLTVVTSVWGDLVGNCSVTPCTPPDGIVNFDDIAAVVDKFKNRPGAPAKARADVAPDTPDRIINFTDIPAVIDAFKGRPYPYSGPPAVDPCAR